MNQSRKPHQLEANTIGLLGAVTMGVVMLSPAMSLYGVFGPTFLAAGKAAPLAFIWALAATLPTAISYVLLAREHPLSGSAASWIGLTVPRPIANWCGWMVFMYYFTNFIIQPVTLGVFAGDFANAVGITPGLFSYGFGIALCCAWPAWIVYRGISVSAKGALGFLVFESAVVLVLCLSVIAMASRNGTALDLEGFSLTASINGAPGILRAMIFGMLAFCGFDVISTLAEETKMAHRLIPKATLLALLVYALIITFGVWSLSFGGDQNSLRAVAESGRMPISEIADRVWGKGSLLVSLTAVSAALGLAIATSIGASRVLFSLGRENNAPPALARLHPRFGVPWSALNLIFGVGLVAAFLSGLLIGPYTSYVWWATTSTFFAMLTYMMVHFANLVLNRAKARQSFLGWLGYFVVPVFGLSCNAYLLVRSFFLELWSQDWASGKSVVVFDVTCALAIAGIIGWLQCQKRWQKTTHLAPNPALPEQF